MKKYHLTKKILLAVAILALVILSNLYLQWSQNNHSLTLALKFAFSWHTEKFFLGSLVLLIFYGFLASVAGSLGFAALFYTVLIGVLGYADHLKMIYRQEPIYPDDLKMVTQLGLLREMVGTGAFVFVLLLAALAIAALIWSIYRSRHLSKKAQFWRGSVLLVSVLSLFYISHFNSSSNLLRKAYNRTALWIPYSQKMNYYNTGFIGGFLYNLRVVPMDQPENYSKATIKEITKTYQAQAETKNANRTEEKPNIVYVMSESFSDPSHLKGLTITGDPLKDYYEVADKTYSGKMLSQNYGGGTANIEFEALTSFSMELFNPQMTTPYTLLVPKLEKLPSLVSFLKQKDYQATAIHPYDTSMYKRKDVYNVLGFDSFLDQDTMTYTDKIQKNPYISDESAYKEVLSLLDSDDPQFVHLVTMQTHMPYNGKYENIPYTATGNDNTASLENYLQDVAYSSEALKEFLQQLDSLSRRTVVVFWGDHLPGIYSEAIQEKNAGATLHETQFLMYDSKDELTKDQDSITSPFYFAPTLMEQTQQPTTGFYELLLALEKELPAFEKGMYQQKGTWKKEMQLNKQQEEIYQAYQMIQYDILAGKQYSLQQTFFE
ncbi:MULTISPECIES: LTA synthase family protein [Enterococcus]|uniref:LTA synthase family protein n=1 Tax=Enterococcus TaxID=1350 RepID=UPI0010F84C3E|nr:MULTISPECIES: LTA synthase family protein [Enterococcus]KAF1300773.1 hypothetical protein BAU16_11875 [Enterococcus sp. JM9B]